MTDRDRFVLQKCERAQGQRVPLDVAYHCAELWLLHSSGSVVRNVSDGRDADDPQDLCVCVDRAHWIFCHEEGMPIKEEEI